MSPPVHQPHQQMQKQYVSEEQMLQLQSLHQQRLPSRDIPNDQSTYTHDEEITPNYIPKHKQSNDYVRDYEDMTEKNLKEYEQKIKKEKKIDIILTEIQVPLFLAVLFFFFQLPIVNTLVFKRFSFLSIHTADGNFNFSGLILKSILFAVFYYFILKCTTFLTEL
jgi:Fe2+ transport system protein B